MSLINDALKEARRDPPRTPPVSLAPLPPSAPPPEPLPIMEWLIPGAIIFLIVAAIFFIGWAYAHHTVHAIASNPTANTQQVADVIVPLVSSAPADSPKPVAAPDLPVLQGIFYSPTAPTAIIDGKTVSPGDSFGDYHVKEITKYTVTLIDAQGKSIKIGMGN